MSDRTPPPVLEILNALPRDAVSGLGRAPLALRIMAGQCVHIEAQYRFQTAEIGDLCCGLLPLSQGTVRFLGVDWNRMGHEIASARRGQIGRVYGRTSWIGFLGIDFSILLPQLHHTRRPEHELRNAAAELSRSFGLPGLPTGHPDSLGDIDLVRAACVRAFVGLPRLLILEWAELAQVDNLMPGLVQALIAAQNRHAAIIWLTHSNLVWNDHALPATARFRLTDRGLVPVAERA